MRQQGVPKRLWNYGLVWASEIMNRTARGPDSRTPYEIITGNTLDISEWLNFSFYDWCWYWSGLSHELTDDKAELGRVIGVAHRVGSDMCYWVLTETCKVLGHTTVQRVTQDDMLLPHVVNKMNQFTIKAEEGLNDVNHLIDMPPDGLTLNDDVSLENDQQEEQGKAERDDFTEETYDAYIGAELLIPHGDTFITGRVIKCTRDEEENLIGH